MATINKLRFEYEEIVTQLLQTQQSDPGHANLRGDTALIMAAEYGREKIVAQLLQTRQSHPGHINREGKTALTMAAQKGYQEIAHKIKEALSQEAQLWVKALSALSKRYRSKTLIPSEMETSWQPYCRLLRQLSPSQFDQLQKVAVQAGIIKKPSPQGRTPEEQRKEKRSLCAKLAQQLADLLEAIQAENTYTLSLENAPCYRRKSINLISFNSIPDQQIIVDDDGHCFYLSELGKLLKTPSHPYNRKPWDEVKVKEEKIADYYQKRLTQQSSLTPERQRQMEIHGFHPRKILSKIHQINQAEDQLMDLITSTETGITTYFQFSDLRKYRNQPQLIRRILVNKELIPFPIPARIINYLEFVQFLIKAIKEKNEDQHKWALAEALSKPPPDDDDDNNDDNDDDDNDDDDGWRSGQVG